MLLLTSAYSSGGIQVRHLHAYLLFTVVLLTPIHYNIVLLLSSIS